MVLALGAQVSLVLDVWGCVVRASALHCDDATGISVRWTRATVSGASVTGATTLLSTLALAPRLHLKWANGKPF